MNISKSLFTETSVISEKRLFPELLAEAEISR